MARRRSLETKLAELATLARDPHRDGAADELRRALRDASNLVAGKAAQIVAEAGLEELAPELVEAFERFLHEPETTDKNCTAKSAIVDALQRFGWTGPGHADLFLRAIGHRQLEPVWGQKIDSAAELRALAALGLVRAGYVEVMVEIATLLADPEPAARAGAARAAGHSGRRDAIALLRYKALIGDPHPAVTGAAFDALLELAPDSSLELVARHLDANDEEVAELAAMALGESRQEAALEPLVRRFRQTQPGDPLAGSVLLAIAMLRQEAAIAFVIERIHDPSEDVAGYAVRALRLHRHDDALAARVTAAIDSAPDDGRRRALATSFAGGV